MINSELRSGQKGIFSPPFQSRLVNIARHQREINHLFRAAVFFKRNNRQRQRAGQAKVLVRSFAAEAEQSRRG